jgi:hypothetical protein
MTIGWRDLLQHKPPPEEGSGVREPLRPLPPVRTNQGYFDED